VANRVVYVGSSDDNIYAFSASGTTNCAGTPKTCQPLWVGATGGPIYASPAIADGVVYIPSDDGKLYAFRG
jgi:outer membrane protein assembly factor BamB